MASCSSSSSSSSSSSLCRMLHSFKCNPTPADYHLSLQLSEPFCKHACERSDDLCVRASVVGWKSSQRSLGSLCHVLPKLQHGRRDRLAAGPALALSAQTKHKLKQPYKTALSFKKETTLSTRQLMSDCCLQSSQTDSKQNIVGILETLNSFLGGFIGQIEDLNSPGLCMTMYSVRVSCFFLVRAEKNPSFDDDVLRHCANQNI